VVTSSLEILVPLGNRGRSLLIGLQPRGAGGAPPRTGGTDVADLLDAVDRARAAAGLDADRIGLLLADAGDDLVAAGRERGFVPVAVVEAPGDTFAFRHGDDFAQHVEGMGADLASVRLRWDPDDDADRKKTQALGLTKLAAWLHETDRRLLLEVVVPTPTADATLDAVREIRDLGTEPDLWAFSTEVSGFADLDALARDAGRVEVAVLALALDPVRDPLPPGRGVVLDHAAWAGALDDADDAIVRALGLDPPAAARPA
jgi:myo-inositol catabolism protein IolC